MIITNKKKQDFISASKENKTLFLKIAFKRYFYLLYTNIFQKASVIKKQF